MKTIIHTDNAPAAIGPYSQAVDLGSLVFTSGQIALDPATGEVVEGGIVPQTEQVFRNIEAILTAAGMTTENVVKTVVYLADINDFGTVNQIYARHFSGDCPARSAVQVAALPKGALVEIECICAR